MFRALPSLYLNFNLLKPSSRTDELSVQSTALWFPVTSLLFRSLTNVSEYH